MDWSKYPNFNKHEFDCKHTGLNRMRPEFMYVLQEMRTLYGKRMVISSGYRDKTHPIEAAKSTPGEHFHGCAADIKVSGPDAIHLIAIAHRLGVTRIGVQQKGDANKRYLHIGIGDKLGLDFPPAMWSY